MNGAARGTRSRTPADVSVTRSTLISTNYSAGLSVSSFELNLFGRVRSNSNAAMASYLATAAAQHAVRLSLITEVVKVYLNARALKEQLDLALRTLTSREDGYKLTEQRFDNGASSALDLQASETLLYQARGDAASLTRSAAQAENALVVLLGAARATFFPRILITASVSQLAWSFAPSLTLPIFDFGRNMANLDVAEVRKNIGVAQYEKTIQTAFREVADALAGRATLDDQLAAAEG
ncbi:MAG: TolC family protein [Candidatus Protistobacter heckmanni]|nr:TolC family protein [Candidatus Protistobacter heckmanni]